MSKFITGKRVSAVIGILIKIFIVVVIFSVIFAAIRGVNYWRSNIDSNDNYYLTHNKESFEREVEDARVVMISYDELHGFHIKPKEITKKGIIITFGDELNDCNYERAMECAANGYEVMSFFYFGKMHQTDYLSEVPLEYFQTILDYAKKNCTSTDIITVIGSSKGAEMALLLQNYYPEITNLVLFSPSSHVFQGLGDEATSSWSFKGEPIPFVDFKSSSLMSRAELMSSDMFYTNYSFRSRYSSSLKNSDNADAAKIKTDNFKGKILLFAGEDDRYWNSAAMAKEIYEDNKDKAEIYTYPNVGHNFLKGSSLYRYKLG
ncbi:MAG: acyl-CoA thioester hydrolase/BAAT C-terminal domain-containing protein, partial [Oscillospiraceae bacterium]